MTAHAHQTADHSSLLAGRVGLIEGERCTVRVEEGGSDVIARVAASCLLAPQPTDRVLLAMAPEPFILAVLERDREQPAVIAIDGDARVHATGKLELEGGQAVNVRSRGMVGVVADKLKLHSRRAEVASELLTAVAKTARGSFETAALVGERLDVVAERMVQKAARAYRTITEFEQLRARHFDYRADGHARITAQSTVITAREVVKMDGEQVHIG